MPISAACSVLSAYFLVILLLLAGGATGAPVDVSGGNTTSSSNATLAATGTGEDSSPATVAGDSYETYICYLCAGRNPLLIRWCPIYWPDCHAYDCSYPAAVATAPAARSSSAMEDDPCYVMKLFQNGTHVDVTRVDCSVVATCRLSCGGGDVADGHGNKALGAAASGTLLPRVADFQRCASQAAKARAAAVPGGA